MALQVQQMFPHYPLWVLVADLRVSHSAELTVENILEGRLLTPAPMFNQEMVEIAEDRIELNQHLNRIDDQASPK